jgi:hypothetical protein
MTSNRDVMALEHAERVRGGNEWKRTNCGWCELRGLGWDHRGGWCLNTTTGYYHCWRCGVKGYLPGYSPPEESAAEEPIGGIDPPEGFVALGARGYGFDLAGARRYVLRRGISRGIALQAGIGACLRGPLAGRIVVPIYDDEDRAWVGYSARLYVPPRREHEPKYRYPAGMPRARIVYNQSALAVDTDRALLVVEGVFDALPYYPDAVALLGKPSRQQVDLLCQCERPIVVALDGDAWLEGYWLAQQLRFQADAEAHALRLPPRTDPCSVEPGWVQAQISQILGSAAARIGH